MCTEATRDLCYTSVVKNAEVVIYTTGYCGYCHAAKRLLAAKNIPFEEIGCDGRQDLRAWLVSVSGQRTVPQIFINGESIGGYTELAGLERSGTLDRRVEVAPDRSSSLRR